LTNSHYLVQSVGELRTIVKLSKKLTHAMQYPTWSHSVWSNWSNASKRSFYI